MPCHVPCRRKAGLRRIADAVAFSALFAILPIAAPAIAATPKDILIEVGEHGPNSLDPMTPAANELVATCRLADLRSPGHARHKDPAGRQDHRTTTTKIEPELATSWDISEDGKTMVFHLRKDATFHDGSPVTADDVKWSFDRAIAAGGFPAIQMAAGSYTDPNIFSVVDDQYVQDHAAGQEQARAARSRRAGA